MKISRCVAVLMAICVVLSLGAVSGSAAESVDEVLQRLAGLPFDEFAEASYRALLARDPEGATMMGLTDLLNLRHDRLTDVSPAYVLETQRLESGILDLLAGYDRASLSEEGAVAFDVYEWLLATNVAGHPFAFHNYPLCGFLTFGYAGALLDLFTETHPLETVENVEDYISRVEAVPAKVGQILEAMNHRESLGFLTPRFLIEPALEVVEDLLGPGSGYRSLLSQINIERSDAFRYFAEGLEALEDLSEADRESLLAAGRTAFEDAYAPALWDLKAFVEDLVDRAPADGGATAMPEGDAFFAWQLGRQTSTDLTPQEVHELGRSQVDRVLEEMRDAFAALGYDRDAPMSELRDAMDAADRWLSSTSSSGRAAILAEFERIKDETNAAIAPYFGLWPDQDVAFAFSPPSVGINYYNTPALDGSRPGTYYISGRGISFAAMPGTFHHEAIPGHHFQLTIAVGLDIPLVQRVIDINAYTEGWALYCERLTYDLGLYEDAPYANLRRLDLELMRAARLVLDTGIHWLGWTREEAAAYMEDIRGYPRGVYVGGMSRYYVLPGQASTYMIGKLEIERLRDKARSDLGDAFDLARFHDAILGYGTLPLAVLEDIIDAYVRQATP